MKIECPKCLGLGELYSQIEDNMIKCNLCKGKMDVEEEIADLYDPVADMLSEMSNENE